MTSSATLLEPTILVDRLVSFDVSGSSPAELDAALGDAGRLARWLDAVDARLRAERQRRTTPSPRPGGRPAPKPKPSPREPGAGSNAEDRRRELAATGARRAPTLAAALEAGQVSRDHLIAIGRVRNHDAIAAAEPRLLEAAISMTADSFGTWLEHWDTTIDEARGADVDARRRAKRRLSFSRGTDGMGITRIELPPLEHNALMSAVDRTAEQRWRSGDDRTSTLPQRYADALVALVLGAGERAATPAAADDAPDLPAGGAAGEAPGSSSATARAATAPTPPRRPTVVVLVRDIDLLAGRGAVTLDGTALGRSETDRLLCLADLIPVLVDGRGQILKFGRTRRYASDAQWLALLARDGGCVVADCPAHAAWCDAHHCREWDAGGCTDLDNLCLLCPTHHRLLHALGWRAVVVGGRVRITTRDGTDVPTRNRTDVIPADETLPTPDSSSTDRSSTDQPAGEGTRSRRSTEERSDAVAAEAATLFDAA